MAANETKQQEKVLTAHHSAITGISNTTLEYFYACFKIFSSDNTTNNTVNIMLIQIFLFFLTIIKFDCQRHFFCETLL